MSLEREFYLNGVDYRLEEKLILKRDYKISDGYIYYRYNYHNYHNGNKIPEQVETAIQFLTTFVQDELYNPEFCKDVIFLTEQGEFSLVPTEIYTGIHQGIPYASTDFKLSDEIKYTDYLKFLVDHYRPYSNNISPSGYIFGEVSIEDELPFHCPEWENEDGYWVKSDCLYGLELSDLEYAVSSLTILGKWATATIEEYFSCYEEKEKEKEKEKKKKKEKERETLFTEISNIQSWEKTLTSDELYGHFGYTTCSMGIFKTDIFIVKIIGNKWTEHVFTIYNNNEKIKSFSISYDIRNDNDGRFFASFFHRGYKIKKPSIKLISQLEKFFEIKRNNSDIVVSVQQTERDTRNFNRILVENFSETSILKIRINNMSKKASIRFQAEELGWSIGDTSRTWSSTSVASSGSRINYSTHSHSDIGDEETPMEDYDFHRGKEPGSSATIGGEAWEWEAHYERLVEIAKLVGMMDTEKN